MVVSLWLKSGGGSQGVVGEEGAWADTQLLCIPGNQTQPGSRTIEEADRASGAGRVGSLWSGLAVGVALGVWSGL